MSSAESKKGGCCSSESLRTPLRIHNRPTQPSINYRVGTHADFKNSLLSSLSSAKYPTLKQLSSRDDDDFSIAWLDAVATTLDVITFYQERFANEHYLATSMDRRSVGALAELIGYQLAPGVSASTHLAFTLQETPGLDSLEASEYESVEIPPGSKVQSVPGQDEAAQTFETAAPITANAAWNSVKIQNHIPYHPKPGDREVYIKGIDNVVSVGDSLLIIHQQRFDNPSSTAWEIRRISSVIIDKVNLTTQLKWDNALQHSDTLINLSDGTVSLFVFRKRAALYGHNAPDPRLMTTKGTNLYTLLNNEDQDKSWWKDYHIKDDQIDISPPLENVAEGSWIALTSKTAESPDADQIQHKQVNPNFADKEESQVLKAQTNNGAVEAIIASGELDFGGNASNDLTANRATNGATNNNSEPDNTDPTTAKFFDPSLTEKPKLSSSHTELVQLYRVGKASEESRVDFGMNARITRVVPDDNVNLYRFGLLGTSVLAESASLAIAPRPLDYPVYGDTIALAAQYHNLHGGKPIAISGHLQKIKVAPGVTGLILWLGEDVDVQSLSKKMPPQLPLRPGDCLTLTAVPERISISNSGSLSTALSIALRPDEFSEALRNPKETLSLQVISSGGEKGTVITKAGDILLAPHQAEEGQADDLANEYSSELLEIASTADAVTHDQERTTIKLNKPLKNFYQRASVRLNFNVVAATHGETVSEVLGSGNTKNRNQKFALKQSPLSYVSANTPSGSESTLKLSVNDIAWTEKTNLYGEAKEGRSYQIDISDEGSASIQFGDGVEGALLPTGQQNIRVDYRKGLGEEGNIATGKLSTLLTRPLGVVEVTNPEPASGGENPEQMDAARSNAPMTVTTLDRAVSISDYQQYAQSFAGIDRAHAIWVESGPARGIFLSVAGAKGAVLDESSATIANLAKSLRRFGDPLLPISINSFRKATFSLEISIKPKEEVNPASVFESVRKLLRTHFSFENRQFGQDVSRDEIISVVHSISDVKAVRINTFFKNQAGNNSNPAKSIVNGTVTNLSPAGTTVVFKTIAEIVTADLPLANALKIPEAAELLCLSDDPIAMELML